MKSVMFFFLIVILVVPLFQVQSSQVLDLEGCTEVYIVKTVDGKQKYEKLKSEENSFNYINNSDGMLMVFDLGKDDVLNNLSAKIVMEENIEGLYITYAYSTLYNDFIYVNGKQVNVQLVQKNGKTVAGMPLILSGF